MRPREHLACRVRRLWQLLPQEQCSRSWLPHTTSEALSRAAGQLAGVAVATGLPVCVLTDSLSTGAGRRRKAILLEAPPCIRPPPAASGEEAVLAQLGAAVAALPACTGRLRMPLAAELAASAPRPIVPSAVLQRSTGSVGSTLVTQLPEPEPPDPASVVRPALCTTATSCQEGVQLHATDRAWQAGTPCMGPCPSSSALPWAVQAA